MFKIAHRGFVNQCRENSIESIKNAIEHGFDMVEIDVQLTKDDIIILYHDIRIEDKLIKELTYSEIMRFVHVDTLDVVLNTFDMFDSCYFGMFDMFDMFDIVKSAVSFYMYLICLICVSIVVHILMFKNCVSSWRFDKFRF